MTSKYCIKHFLLVLGPHNYMKMKCLYIFFPTLTALYFFGVMRGCWSLSQLHMGQHEVPLQGPYMSIWGFGTLLR